MKIFLLAGLVVFSTTGCSVNKALPDNKYYEYATFKAELQKCFEGGLVSPKLYADSSSAFSYMLTDQRYDKNRISSEAKPIYQRVISNPQTCRNVEAFSYQLISAVTESKAARKGNLAAMNRSSSALLNNTIMRQPMICTQIGGGTTVCN